MTPQEMADQLAKLDYDYWKDKALEKVPSNIDSRQGSIISDSLAPSAYSFAEVILYIRQWILDSYTQTATNQYLDYRGQERGLTRIAASNAVVTGRFLDRDGKPAIVEVGDRFASIGPLPFFYAVSKVNDDGTGQLTSETTGDAPNHYIGQILPITPNDDVADAQIIEISVPARNVETDDVFRKRILANYNVNAYGGNVADYQDMMAQLHTVGAVQIYPTWAGGGTVKLVILDNDFSPPSEQLIHDVQAAIDPQDMPGDGYGLAPIGHTVTVIGPTERKIDVVVTVQTDGSVQVNEVRTQINDAIEGYFDSVRRTWGSMDISHRSYTLRILRAQIIAAILRIPGIINATDLTIAGGDVDIKMTSTGTLSELPVVGEVTVNG
jgi:uncharacterized phage protein gp47/JayE